MGFIVGCILMVVIAKAAWDFFKKPTERQKMVKEYQEKPILHLFLIAWMVFFVMFFVGVFVPVIGQIELTKSGWQIWQVGIIGFFGCWAVTFFVDIEK